MWRESAQCISCGRALHIQGAMAEKAQFLVDVLWASLGVNIHRHDIREEQIGWAAELGIRY